MHNKRIDEFKLHFITYIHLHYYEKYPLLCANFGAIELL